MCDGPARMTPDPAVLERLLRLLHERTGFDLTGYRLAGLSRRAHQRAALAGYDDLADYLPLVADDDQEAAVLLDHLLVLVSGWFRDPHVWQVVRGDVLPSLAGRDGARGIRAWVAGCGEGQEVWSLGSCLAGAEAAGRLPSWSVLATDVDAQALRRVQDARYPTGHVPPGWQDVIEPYLEPRQGHWQVVPALTSRVSVGRHDVRDAPPEDAATPFDLVMCRNVLMYLDAAVQVRVLDGLLASLRPGGVLVLGQAELPIDRRDVLVPVDSAARVYRSIGAPVPTSRPSLPA